MKYIVSIEKDYEESWVTICDESGKEIEYISLREPEILNWLESQGMLEQFIRFMIRKMLNGEWVKYWDSTKNKWLLEIDVNK